MKTLILALLLLTGSAWAVEPSRIDFETSASVGWKDGVSLLEVYGLGIDIDAADGYVTLWDGSNTNTAEDTYTFSSTADIDTVSSTLAQDTQAIEIKGLDANWEQVTQMAYLNGQSKVTLTTPLIRVYKMNNISPTAIAGQVYLYPDTAITSGKPDDTGKVRGMIRGGFNHSLSAVISIPAGKTGLLVSYGRSIVSKVAGYSSVRVWIRKFGQPFHLENIGGISTTGTSEFEHKYRFMEKLPAKTDLYMDADASANNTSVSGEFVILLVNE